MNYPDPVYIVKIWQVNPAKPLEHYDAVYFYHFKHDAERANVVGYEATKEVLTYFKNMEHAVKVTAKLFDLGVSNLLLQTCVEWIESHNNRIEQ